MSFSSDFDLKDSLSHKMSLSFFADGRKKMTYEGVEISRISEFAGRFRAVFFTPDHLSLIKGSPDERRRFCDMALCQIKPGYIRYLNEYHRILAQRNALLRGAKLDGKLDRAMLDVYSFALAEKAATITRQRAGFAEYLERESAPVYRFISGSRENLFIDYLCAGKQDPSDTEKVKEKYISLYTENVESEIKYGATKAGPHKDDFVFYIAKNKNDFCGEKTDEQDVSYTEFAARTFASQGQQRSAVLALKLAEGEIIKALCGEHPVYLFDDVLSELDSERKECLLSLFEKKQVIITCCDENAFDDSLVSNKIRVENGTYI
jgi:DNA replication and repair protein RecF